MTNHYRCWLPDLPYAATAVNHEHHVDIVVVSAALEEGERIVYVGREDNGAFTRDITQARIELRGSIKWDGCSNWDFMTGDVMAHYCGEEDAAAVGTLMRRLYEWARQLGQDRLDVRPHHDVRVSIRPDTDSVIAYLNELLRIDPVAMGQLVFTTVACNKALADHRSVQVFEHPNAQLAREGQGVVGLLGILNGWCGTIPLDQPNAGYGPITAILEGGKLARFERTEKWHAQQAQAGTDRV